MSASVARRPSGANRPGRGNTSGVVAVLIGASHEEPDTQPVVETLWRLACDPDNPPRIAGIEDAARILDK
jgi:hypothetical protein